MELYDALLTRRSIRAYTSDPVSDVVVDKLINAAMMAPSAGNARPWQFIIVRKGETLNKIGDINPYAKMSGTADVGILICGDLSLEKYPGFWVQDCAAAVQNLLLAAHASGLGAVWTGIYPLEDRVNGFKALFNLPEQVIPLAFVPLGYPSKVPASPDRFEKEKIRKEKWD